MADRTTEIGGETYTSFKREDLGNQKCIACGEGVGHGGIDFYRVRFERFLLNVRGIQQTAGLEMMMGGGRDGAALANIMGPNPDIANGLGQQEFLICGPCSLENRSAIHLPAIAEMLNAEELPDGD